MLFTEKIPPKYNWQFFNLIVQIFMQNAIRIVDDDIAIFYYSVSSNNDF